MSLSRSGNIPANVSTIFACSARCNLCASATSALACLAAASSAEYRPSLPGPLRLPSGPEGSGVCAGLCVTLLDEPAGSSLSENILPMVERGFWMVRSRPVMAAFSSYSPLSSLEGVDFRGAYDGWATASLSIDGLADEASPREPNECGDFSDVVEVGGDSSRCFSAMAETAASTFFSNSSSVMVSVVRSMFSMN